MTHRWIAVCMFLTLMLAGCSFIEEQTGLGADSSDGDAVAAEATSGVSDASMEAEENGDRVGPDGSSDDEHNNDDDSDSNTDNPDEPEDEPHALPEEREGEGDEGDGSEDEPDDAEADDGDVGDALQRSVLTERLVTSIATTSPEDEALGRCFAEQVAGDLSLVTFQQLVENVEEFGEIEVGDQFLARELFAIASALAGCTNDDGILREVRADPLIGPLVECLASADGNTDRVEALTIFDALGEGANTGISIVRGALTVCGRPALVAAVDLLDGEFDQLDRDLLTTCLAALDAADIQASFEEEPGRDGLRNLASFAGEECLGGSGGPASAEDVDRFVENFFGSE